MNDLYVAAISAVRSCFVVEASGALNSIAFAPLVSVGHDHAGCDATDAQLSADLPDLTGNHTVGGIWQSLLHRELAVRIAALGWACACSERMRWSRHAAAVPVGPIDDDDDDEPMPIANATINRAASIIASWKSICTYDRRYLFIIMSVLLQFLNARAAATSTFPLVFQRSTLRATKLLSLSIALAAAAGIVDEIIHFLLAHVLGHTGVLEVHGRKLSKLEWDDVCMFCLGNSSAASARVAEHNNAQSQRQSHQLSFLVPPATTSISLECFCKIDSHLAHPKCMQRWFAMASSRLVGRGVFAGDPDNNDNHVKCPLCTQRLHIQVLDARALIRQNGIITGIIAIARRTIRWRHVFARICTTCIYTFGVFGLFLFRIHAMASVGKIWRLVTDNDSTATASNIDDGDHSSWTKSAKAVDTRDDNSDIK